MLSRLLGGAADLFKTHTFNYCNIETADDPFTLVRKDGGLITVLDINGSYQLVGAKEFQRRLTTMIDRLQGVLAREGARLEFFFSRDPSSGVRMVDESQAGSYQTLKNFRMSGASILKERSEVLGSAIANEYTFLVIHTLPTVLPGPVRAREEKKRMQDENVKRSGMRPGAMGQSPLVAISSLRETHSAFVNNLIHNIKEYVSVERMEVHDVLRSIRMLIDPDNTAIDYRPYLPGDRMPVRMMQEFSTEADMSWIQWPNVGQQIFPQDAELAPEDSSMIKIGRRYYAPIMMDLPPQRFHPFVDLFQGIDGEVPWRMKLTLDTGSDAIRSKLSTKQSLNMIISFTNSNNKLITEDINALLQASERGEPLVNCYMSFSTWGDNYDDAYKYRSMISQSIQSWGHPDILIEKGDPFAALFDTLPAVTRTPISTPFPALLGDALGIAPLTRPASPYKEGSLMFRTLDKKLWPYMVHSSKQTMHIDLIYARPGSGKSVFLGAKNLALLTKPGLDGLLPRISVLDIGHSSKAFSDFVRELLPKSMRHMVEHRRLSMSRDDAINIFDTPLGCRKPLAVDRDFIVDFLSSLMTPVGSDAIDGMMEMVGRLVDSVYDHLIESPKIYEPFVDTLTDQAIEANNIDIQDEMTWFEVVDELFDKGLMTSAARAQRFAVPVLSDVAEIMAQDASVKDIFGEAKTRTGEPLLKACNRMLSSVSGDYPILSNPTMFDISHARIVSLDLMDVCPSGGAKANHQTNLMYMLGMNILTRDFYRSKEQLREIPDKYKMYHAKRIEAEAKSPKHLCMDEFHRTSSAIQVRDNVVRYMREGRKFNVMVTLCSQQEEDFNKEMVNMATNTWVLDRGTEHTVNYLRNVFRPSEDALRGLNTHVSGPSREGVNLLYLGVNKGAKVEQILNFKMSPQEIWALSTTVEDVQIRSKLADSIGYIKAIEILGKRFPGGSCKDYLEARQRMNTDDGLGSTLSEEDKTNAAVNNLYKELVAECF